MKTTNAQLTEKMQKSIEDKILVEEVVHAALMWYRSLQAARMGEELEDRLILFDAAKKLAEHRQ